MAPLIEARCALLSSVLPAMNCAPLCENCTITGLFACRAAASTALMELLPIALTAGRAHFSLLQNAKTSCRAEPTITPGLSFNLLIARSRPRQGEEPCSFPAIHFALA